MRSLYREWILDRTLHYTLQYVIKDYMTRVRYQKRLLDKTHSPSLSLWPLHPNYMVFRDVDKHGIPTVASAELLGRVLSWWDQYWGQKAERRRFSRQPNQNTSILLGYRSTKLFQQAHRLEADTTFLPHSRRLFGSEESDRWRYSSGSGAADHWGSRICFPNIQNRRTRVKYLVTGRKQIVAFPRIRTYASPAATVLRSKMLERGSTCDWQHPPIERPRAGSGVG